MAYVTTNPPNLVLSGFNALSTSIWSYESTDTAGDVDAAGYITDGDALGLKVNDLVLVVDTDASPPVMTSHRVASVTAGGSADLSDLGATLGSTDSD